MSSSQNFVFLLGPWGSGKTTTLKTLASDLKDSTYFEFISFAGVDSAKMALFHFIGFLYRAILFILSLAVFFLIFYFGGKEVEQVRAFFSSTAMSGFTSIALSLAVIFVLIPNSRITILCLLLVKKCFYLLDSNIDKKTRIIIIDDLDRSSMSLSERFAFLSQLPPIFDKVIVAYGYSNNEESISVLELASKLGSTPIELRQNAEITYQILKNAFPFLPFRSAGEWMAHIPLRAHFRILQQADRELANENEFLKKQAVLMSYANHIGENLITHESGSDGSELSLAVSGNQIDLTNKTSLTPREGLIVSSFAPSIDQDYFTDCFERGIDPSEKVGIGYAKPAWSKTISDKEYRANFIKRLEADTLFSTKSRVRF